MNNHVPRKWYRKNTALRDVSYIALVQINKQIPIGATVKAGGVPCKTRIFPQRLAHV